jgi:hypothetical protein
MANVRASNSSFVVGLIQTMKVIKKIRRSVIVTVVYLNDMHIVFSSVMQKHVMLSVTEAELAAVVTMVQDKLYL